ncbi:MAG TPA: cupredoxin family copper-binding protein [Gemmatimonadales bacterium]|nr:cupredoxin family copper-binding protein [Gemmatimonadales bacterium]
MIGRFAIVLPLAAFAAGGGGGGRARPSRAHAIEIHGMAFHPASLNVSVGDTVVWINRDIVPHTATGRGRRQWDSGQLQQGDSGRYVPRRSGRAPYTCTLHPTMKGLLIIGRE